MPSTPFVFHGFVASSGPMNISYMRSVSAPYSFTMSSGLMTLPRDLLIFSLFVAEDHALVHQLLERLLRRHDADVVQHLVPEPRIQQVQHRMLGAADVQVDRQPFLLHLLRIDSSLVVVRIDEAQVVPAASRPLRHRVRLAACLAVPSPDRPYSPIPSRWPAAIPPCPTAGSHRHPAAAAASPLPARGFIVPSSRCRIGIGSPQ